MKPVAQTLEEQFLRAIIPAPENVIVISDYAKGVITPHLVKKIIASGKRIIVDPKSFDFGTYGGSYLLTPNLMEISSSAGVRRLPFDTIENVCRKLIDKHAIANILVTLGPGGMLLIEKDAPALHIHNKAREVYDVTGAGDTVIAVVSAALAADISLPDACHVANIAAGIVVGKHFTATAKPEEIMNYAFGPISTDKIVSQDVLLSHIAAQRKAGKSIVFTNGCFDLLHMGHITYLNEARALGDLLVVGVNTDRSVRALKGEQRPIIPELERSHILAALESVDFVILFDENTPLELIQALRPDILVKGADYTKEQVVGLDIVESYGGSVVLLPLVENMSTSALINRIKEQY